ncbi:hypothetical protein XE97_25045, partial [Salmonella enterica subsp. enterica serovar Senftenberg]|nr:hypothetical protein [Salmonella enterica subsp. enterica serovar Senftenberg]
MFIGPGGDAGKYTSADEHGLGTMEANSAAQAVTTFQTMRGGTGWGAVARCDRFVVSTTEITSSALSRLVVKAFPDCSGSLESGDSQSPADAARAAAAAAAPPPSVPELSVTTYTPPPKPLPVSGWDDTQSEVRKAFEVSGFHITPTSDGANLTIKVHNRTGQQLSFSPSVTYTTVEDGDGYTYGYPTDCWTFSPHDTDTLHLVGHGLDDRTGT